MPKRETKRKADYITHDMSKEARQGKARDSRKQQNALK